MPGDRDGHAGRWLEWHQARTSAPVIKGLMMHMAAKDVAHLGSVRRCVQARTGAAYVCDVTPPLRVVHAGVDQ